MKAIITLRTVESVKFMKELDLESLKKDLDFVYPNSTALELTIRGDFYVTYTALSLWIENEEKIILKVPTNIIKSFVCKENEK